MPKGPYRPFFCADLSDGLSLISRIGDARALTRKNARPPVPTVNQLVFIPGGLRRYALRANRQPEN